MTRTRDECGTPVGFDFHVGRTEQPCGPCRAAKQEQRERWKAAAAAPEQREAVPAPQALAPELATILGAHHAGELVLG
jgi:hypothetical protein